MYLRIETTWAKMALKQTPPQLKTTIHMPDLPLEIRLPEIRLRQKPTRLLIEQDHVWEQLGQRQPQRFARYCGQKGWDQAEAATVQMAQEGDRLARVEANNNPIPDIARESFTDTAEVNLTCWPTVPPQITVVSGYLDADVQLGCVNAIFRQATVNHRLSWGKVQAYLVQKPAIEMELVMDLRV
ncbi:MAG: DUF6470 family protein [bacterium]|jgi:hypothetical protein